MDSRAHFQIINGEDECANKRNMVMIEHLMSISIAKCEMVF